MTAALALYHMYYVAARLSDGETRTQLEAERTAYDALLSFKSSLSPPLRAVSVGVYDSGGRVLVYDGDTTHAAALKKELNRQYFSAYGDCGEKAADIPSIGRVYAPRPVLSFKFFVHEKEEA